MEAVGVDVDAVVDAAVDADAVVVGIGDVVVHPGC